MTSQLDYLFIYLFIYLLLDILHKVGTISKIKHLPKWAQKPVLWPDYCLIVLSMSVITFYFY